MTEFSLFWNTSRASGDRPTKYSESHYHNLYRYLIPGADDNTRGVVRLQRNQLRCVANSPADASVTLKSGTAIVAGGIYTNDADITVTPTANLSGSTRIDLLVIRLDYATGQIRHLLRAGTPGAGVPVDPITSGSGTVGFFEIPIAEISLASGFSTIAQSVITDRRSYAFTEDVIITPIINQSASVLNTGNIVIRDTSGGSNKVTTSTTPADSRVWGVIEGKTQASGGAGRIVQFGIFPVICSESVAIGDKLEHSATAGQARKQIRTSQPAFAIVLEANSGAATPALCFVNCLSTHLELVEPILDVYMSANTVTGALTKLAFNTIATDFYNEFSTVNNRWTPRLGQYSNSILFRASGGTGTAYFYKNGAAFRLLTAPLNANGWMCANGINFEQTVITDYYEVFVAGGTVTGGNVADGARWTAIRR